MRRSTLQDHVAAQREARGSSHARAEVDTQVHANRARDMTSGVNL